jgi:hypothetical protein
VLKATVTPVIIIGTGKISKLLAKHLNDITGMHSVKQCTTHILMTYLLQKHVITYIKL